MKSRIRQNRAARWLAHVEQWRHSGMSKADPSFKDRNWQEQDRLMFPLMITRNVARFTEVLSRDLGVAAGAVEFRDVAEGRIQLDPDGALQVDEAPG